VQARVIARILGGAGYAVVSFVPLKKIEGWRADGRVIQF
jgi:hypothetical protein